MQEQSTIRVSVELLNILKKFKDSNESYEEVIMDFIEPHLELSKEAQKDVDKSLKEYKRGEFFTFEQMKQEFGF
jgi:hypothetical protein